MDRTSTTHSILGDDSRTQAGVRGWPPAGVAAATTVAGFVILTLLLVGVGFIVTRSFLSGSIVSWDESVNRWLELRRTATLNTWTDVGSIMAGSGTILLVAGISVACLLIRRLWHDAGLLAMGLFIEFSVFLTTNVLVDRPRPTVQPLDPLPLTSSFPSGHAAAAIVVYVGLAIIVSSHTRSRGVRIAVWIVGILLPIWVGFSRVYRGMHHPSDVAASIVLGTGALLFAGLAVRWAATAARYRKERASSGHRTQWSAPGPHP